MPRPDRWRRGLPPVGIVCDMAHDEICQEMDEDGTLGPERAVRVVWRMARVLAQVDGGDLIVQHLIEGAPKGVLPRLTRVYRAARAAYEWRPIAVPEGV